MNHIFIQDDDIKLNTELDEQDGNGELPEELLAGEKSTGDPKDDDIGLDTEPNEPDVEDELPNELLTVPSRSSGGPSLGMTSSGVTSLQCCPSLQHSVPEPLDVASSGLSSLLSVLSVSTAGDPKDDDIGLDTEPNEPDVEDELLNELLAGEKLTDVPKDDDIKLNTELDEQDRNGELPDELLAGEKRTGAPKDDDIGLDTEPNEPDVEDELQKELLAGEKHTDDPKDDDVELDNKLPA